MVRRCARMSELVAVTGSFCAPPRIPHDAVPRPTFTSGTRPPSPQSPSVHHSLDTVSERLSSSNTANGGLCVIRAARCGPAVSALVQALAQCRPRGCGNCAADLWRPSFWFALPSVAPSPFNFLRSLDGPPPPSPALVSDYQSVD